MANESNQLKQTVEGLEGEHEFYFSKLRDIELLIQQAVEADARSHGDVSRLLAVASLFPEVASLGFRTAK